MIKIQRLFIIFLMLSLSLGLAASSALQPIQAALAQEGGESSSTFRWELVVPLSPESIRLPAQEMESWTEAVKGQGIAASFDINQITMQGQDGPEQLRSALFDTAKPALDFLGGRVELTLNLTADGSTPLVLNLETRITAGYSWDLVPGDGQLFSVASEPVFVSRYRAYGAPSIQTIQLAPAGAGDTVVRLIYHRSFEPDGPIHARLNVWMPGSSGAFELSDPTPSTAFDNPSSEASTQAPDPFEDLAPQTLPTSWDWRTKGIVPAIRNQNPCGSCWAFGTVGIMESALKKAWGPGSGAPNLSEQFLISCNYDGWDCDGGLTAHKYHYNTKGKNQTGIGAVMETAKPYTASNGTCTSAYSHPYKLSNWIFITGSEWTVPTVDQIKNAIYTYGPITAGVCVGNQFKAYTNGIYSTTENVCGGSTNHQIILVGWNNTGQYWILRNSWGTSWGESGYMRIKWNTSRVGEGTSWTTTKNYTLTTYNPHGDTYTTKPTYSWKRNSSATSYYLRVYDSNTLANVVSTTVSSSYCSTSTNRCSYTPSTALTLNKTYKWKVAAHNSNITSAYAAYRTFKVLPGIDTSFNGSASGWVVRPGGSWSFYNNAYYKTSGVSQKWSSISYNKTFSNFNYAARIKRSTAGSGYSNTLIVRGTPTFASDNGWRNGYFFQYSNDGDFSIWKNVNGTITTLKNWTISSAVHIDDWNTLKVIADGKYFKFYINGTLVWSGSDTSFTSGQVGLMMYRDTTAETFYVDWAKLAMSQYYSMASLLNAAEVIEENQVELVPPPGYIFGPEGAFPVAP